MLSSSLLFEEMNAVAAMGGALGITWEKYLQLPGSPEWVDEHSVLPISKCEILVAYRYSTVIAQQRGVR